MSLSKIIRVPYTNERLFRKVPFLEQIKAPVGRYPDGYEFNDEVWDWCEANLPGKWEWWTSNRPKTDPLYGREIDFTDATAAMLFKLMWCGVV